MSFQETDEDGFGPADVIRLTGVSRETISSIQAYLAVLDAWRERINLIGPGEGRHLWRRHVLDSLQLLDQIGPDDKNICDLGSGAGLPGLILACAFVERAGVTVTLVEKSVRKSQFLEAASQALALPARVLNQRLEDLPTGAAGQKFDVVTARALAPLPRLLGYADPWLKPSGKALLMKGKDAAEELATARQSWTFDLSSRVSASSPEGQILTITSLGPRRT